MTMKFGIKALLGGAALLGALLAVGVQATNYSVWINGRTGGGQLGNHDDFTYFGPGTVNAGVNKKSANWDGYNRVADQNVLIRNALDCYCTGPNWCYIAAHSAGNLQIGYALDFFGGSQRSKKDPALYRQGQCDNSREGGTQTGWNIKWVDVAGGAGGGSELANAGEWALSEPLVSDLKTSTARALYNHNNTRGSIFYMFAGAKGTLYSFLLPGQDDEVVAYHSAGGVSGTSGASYCNPSDWFCNDLTLGAASNQGGRAKWANHAVQFRDDGESVTHYNQGQWAGIVGKVRADMETHAR
jgi:hypothetical protein